MRGLCGASNRLSSNSTARPGLLLATLLATLLAASMSLPAAEPDAPKHRGSLFRGWTDFRTWDRASRSSDGRPVWISPEITVSGGWRELVVSWNADAPPGSGLKIEARALRPEGATHHYVLAWWSADPQGHPRESVSDQSDAEGEVQTDTLVLPRLAPSAQVRLTLKASPEGKLPELTFVGVSCLNPDRHPPPLRPHRRAWGRTLGVPERSQVNYPGGEQSWCSPTSVSMVLAYWARELRQPGLDRDVPEVVQGVFDPKWPGTGNWPFNTAYAGSLPGLRAYVTRLTDVAELEAWVARGVPVVVSVCYDLLRGRPRQRDSGHLVVCAGFAANGDVVINDPGTRTDVRHTFPRENLVRAWANSKNTVYLIYPANWRPPRDRFGHWYPRRR